MKKHTALRKHAALKCDNVIIVRVKSEKKQPAFDVVRQVSFIIVNLV